MRDSHEQGVATSLRDRFNRLATRVTTTVGSPVVLGAAVALILLWALSGPFFGFSETWQLVINTATTIITFLMVFVIQASQNRDSKAIHLKLDEVIRAHRGARNEMIGAESHTEAELRRREEEFTRIAEQASAVALAEDAADPAASDADVVRRATRSPSVRAAVRSAARSTTGSTKPATKPATNSTTKPATTRSGSRDTEARAAKATSRPSVTGASGAATSPRRSRRSRDTER